MSDVAIQRREAFKAWVKVQGGVKAVSEKAEVPPTTIYSYLAGKGKSLTGSTASKIAEAYGITTDDMFGGAPMVRVLGKVGANPDGDLLNTSADGAYDFVPIPPGGTSDSVALEVEGISMRGIADDGALIYFERQELPPSEALIGEEVVVETVDGRVLFKRLLRGKEEDCYDLESRNGEKLENIRLVWAAEPTAIIPPRQARRIIKRGLVD